MTPMAKISQFKIVRAVMAAGMASVPFCIVGSMFLVFNTLPMTFTGLETAFDNSVFKIRDLYMIANTATMGILALYFNIVVGYELTKIEEEETGLKVNALNGAMLSVFAFIMTLPELVMQNGAMVLFNDQSESVYNGLRLNPFVTRLGTSGIFIAIVMANFSNTTLFYVCTS